MPINFPNSPALNEQYSYNGTIWEWNGSAWITINMSTNTFVRTFNGLTGAVTGISVPANWFIK